MTTDLPEPLTPADCDLRDFPYMPIDIMRLFNSTFHARANDSEWRAGFTLWLKSWHQVPAASVPDDDVLLCRLAELGRDLKEWTRLRVVSLHGWIKCADGRLYHPVVAEKANEAIAKKRFYSDRSRMGNAARKANLHGTDKETFKEPYKDGEGNLKGPLQGNLNGIHQGDETDPTRHPSGVLSREGKREREKKEYPLTPINGGMRARAVRANHDFGEFYQAYPRHDAPDDALKAYEQAIKSGATHADIMAGLARYRFNVNPKMIRLPAGWLRGGCWKAEQNTFDSTLRAVGLKPEDFENMTAEEAELTRKMLQ